MRIGVTGGRDFSDWQMIQDALSDYTHINDTIVEGGARGVDRMCRHRAKKLGMKVETHLPDWEKFGKRAGFIRNQEMVDSGLHLLLAFPGGNGTADMVSRALKAGIEVIMISPKEKS